MSRTAKTIATAGVLAIGVIVALLYHVHTLQQQLDVLEPHAVKYRFVCAGVRAQLHLDRRLLKNPREREGLLAHFGGACGDDSYVMMERCLPAPFPMDAWQACESKQDLDCLDGLLRTAEDAVP